MASNLIGMASNTIGRPPGSRSGKGGATLVSLRPTPGRVRYAAWERRSGEPKPAVGERRSDCGVFGHALWSW